MGYVFPSILQVPTFVPCAAVLLEFGTEEQKKRHLPKIMSGEEIWMQFLSEPSGGSDVAAALTTATRDGDEWVVNGSKIWTTGAWFSDYGLCLLRTNWDVPKHRGLSVFIIKIHQPNIELHRIEMINGSREFCQEFMTDLRVPDSDRVGEVDQGWTVGTRWMFHERNAVGGGSPYVSGPAIALRWRRRERRSAHRTGQEDRPSRRLADARSHRRGGHAQPCRCRAPTTPRGGHGRRRVPRHDRRDRADDELGRRRVATSTSRSSSRERARPRRTRATSGPARGCSFLMRQSGSIGGGTTEMARNNVSERVLGMPREMTHDRNLAFRDVPKGPPSN